jgi:tRNA threonylcarbamoyladenosine modification (KEOPS) complex  Pcc1 subunit
MYRLVINVGNDELVLRIFKILESEVRFPRGRLYVEGENIVAEAADAASLRSLLHTVMRALYVVEHLSEL